jgi:hypothetical protein
LARLIVLPEYKVRLVRFAVSCLCAKLLYLIAELLCEGSIASLVCLLGLSGTFACLRVEGIYTFLELRVFFLDCLMRLVIKL